MIQKSTPRPQNAKSDKRSIFGLLFNPHLGSGLAPLAQNTAIFLRLLANVFAIYGLFPKDHPALRDETVPLSFMQIISTAWQRVEFTRAGLPRTLMFFSVIGVMAATLLITIFTLLGLVSGHAHAQGINASTFAPESSDVAQAWLDYLFNNTPLPNYYTNMGNAIPQGLALQQALTTALAFYSGAILIVAALILFYHLTAMIVETAHHGQVMGKRANQIWAPIRLVFAIGLLVPVNGGLSCGQYIVIKIAELGSGMASQTWDVFLNAMSTYSPTAIPPNSPIVTQIAADLIASEACMYDYNLRVQTSSNDLPGLTSAKMQVITTADTVDGHTGKKYSFTTPDLAGQDICGWYFIPDVPTGTDPTVAQAYSEESSVLTSAITSFETAAQEIKNVMPVNAGGTAGTQNLTLDPTTINAVIQYQENVNKGMVALAAGVTPSITASINQMKPYGWVFAGAFFPTVERMTAMVANAVSAGMPVTQPPAIDVPEHSSQSGWFSRMFGGNHGDEEWDIRRSVSEDLGNFNVYMSKSWAQKQNMDTQCAAMLGLQDNAQGGGIASSLTNFVFGIIDRIASWNGVWRSGSTGVPCSGAATGTPSTFQVGIDLSGPDILQQIAHLGHANIDVATTLLGIGMLAKLGGGIAGAMAGAAVGAAAATAVTGGVGAPISVPFGALFGMAAGKMVVAAAGIFDFFALLFGASGFVLAFVVPMFAFTHFFFAVVSWVGAVIEAVIAVPLIALAHLNPEGDGLPGTSARNAYFFVFSLFLRPVLTVFGLIAGFLAFLVAASFLTYAYNLAVAASGGTAYGHEAMAKVIYSCLYVAFMYICANHSFGMISHIPQHAMNWMGAAGQSAPSLGSADKMQNMENLVGGYAAQQSINRMGQLGNDAGNAVGGAFDRGLGYVPDVTKRRKEIADSAEASDTSQRRHNELRADNQQIIASLGGGPQITGGASGGDTSDGGQSGGGGGGFSGSGGVAGGGYSTASTMNVTSGSVMGGSVGGYSASVQAAPQGGTTGPTAYNTQGAPVTPAGHEGANFGEQMSKLGEKQTQTETRVAHLENDKGTGGGNGGGTPT